MSFFFAVLVTLSAHRRILHLNPQISCLLTVGYILLQFEEANKRALGNKKLEYKDQQEVIEKLEKRTAKLHRDLQYCLKELGVWCAYKVLIVIFDLTEPNYTSMVIS